MNKTHTRRGIAQQENIGQVKPDASRKRVKELSVHALTYKGCRGFTLIELLVVVLIIGILAAVALPQYQKAVEKSRAAQIISTLKILALAQESYYLDHGTYANKFKNLDIQLPADFTPVTTQECYGADPYANSEWCLSLGTNDLRRSIRAERVSGSYKGAGFMYFFTTNDTREPLRTLMCLENTEKISTPGAYCKKLLHGTLARNGSNGRTYTLPN